MIQNKYNLSLRKHSMQTHRNLLYTQCYGKITVLLLALNKTQKEKIGDTFEWLCKDI